MKSKFLNTALAIVLTIGAFFALSVLVHSLYHHTGRASRIAFRVDMFLDVLFTFLTAYFQVMSALDQWRKPRVNPGPDIDWPL